MINFKDPKDQTPSALAVLGIILIAGSVIFSVFFSRGLDAKAYAANAKKEAEALNERSVRAKSDKFVYTDVLNKYQWSDKEDIVTPQALSIISRRTEEHKLNLINFRPNKSSENATMIQLPLQFTVDGSFANVAAMIESLERSDSKLAVQQIQFASQEGETDQVSANISLLAYLAKPVESKTKSKVSSDNRTGAPDPRIPPSVTP